MKNYVIEYQTEPEAVKEFHCTSIKFLSELVTRPFLNGLLPYLILANGTAWCGRRTVTADIDEIVTHIGRQVILVEIQCYGRVFYYTLGCG